MEFKHTFGEKLIQLGASLTQGQRPRTNKQVQIILDKLVEKRSIWRMEINNWQLGREAFFSHYNPTTQMLQEVYHDVMLDDQLTTVTEYRKLRLINKPLAVFDKDGTEDEDKTKLLNDQEWLFNLLDSVMDSIYYGYSLLHLKPHRNALGKINFKIDDDSLVPRGFVSPKNKLILKNELNPTEGVLWEKYPNELLYAQMYSSVGILEKAAPLTILKRHSWGSWDEFEQIFGVPIRIAKYALGNDKVKDEVGTWLEQMGSASYGVFPKEAEIEVVQSKSPDAFNVFLKKIERVDAGLAKLILHQTSTTDEKSYVGSAEVHQNTLEQVTKADERKLSLILNKLVTLLSHWDFGFDGTETIAFKKTISPAKQIEIDSRLLSGGVPLKKEYIERTYGVEVEDTELKPTADPKKKD